MPLKRKMQTKTCPIQCSHYPERQWISAPIEVLGTVLQGVTAKSDKISKVRLVESCTFARGEFSASDDFQSKDRATSGGNLRSGAVHALLRFRKISEAQRATQRRRPCVLECPQFTSSICHGPILTGCMLQSRSSSAWVRDPGMRPIVA